jgi:hypothetical protein
MKAAPAASHESRHKADNDWPLPSLERETLLSDFSGRLSETFPGNTDQSR